MLTKIAENYKQLLKGIIRLTSTHEVVTKYSEEIDNFNKKDLISLPLNEFIQQAIEKDIKLKAKNERKRVKNIFKATVVSLDICFFYFFIKLFKVKNLYFRIRIQLNK